MVRVKLSASPSWVHFREKDVVVGLNTIRCLGLAGAANTHQTSKLVGMLTFEMPTSSHWTDGILLNILQMNSTKVPTGKLFY